MAATARDHPYLGWNVGAFRGANVHRETGLFLIAVRFESQPVGLAEAIDANEAILGGRGQSGDNVCKHGQIGDENGV